MDEYFYPRLGREFSRYQDEEHQFAGIDVSVGKARFDEKLKVRGCLNQAYGWPSFEVSFVNRAGEVQNGWFASPLSTDYYAFIGVYSYGTDENAISDSSAISACNVLWVKKQDVVDAVERLTGFRKMKKDAAELREDPFVDSEGKGRVRYPHRKFWLTFSSRLAEQPVNLVFPRDELRRLPHTRCFVITRDGVKKEG